MVQAAPDMPPADRYCFAREYSSLDLAGRSARAVDILLAYAPWTDAAAGYAAAVRQGFIGRLSTPRGALLEQYAVLKELLEEGLESILASATGRAFDAMIVTIPGAS